MRTFWLGSTSASIMLATLLCFMGTPGLSLAGESGKPVKPSTPAPKAKSVKPKTDVIKYRSAETAAKATACFGESPKIEKLTPDEGPTGHTITIKGSQFGTPDCLRTVAFGPGHSATYTVKNGSTITATVPANSRKGLVLVTVTTASGEDSKPFLIK